MRRPPLIPVIAASAALSLLAPHPNIVHVGYSPIGLTLISIHDCDPESAGALVLTYLVEWAACTLFVYIAAVTLLNIFQKTDGGPPNDQRP
jgi:hypothetical protein